MSDWFEVKEVDSAVWAIREPRHEEQVVSYLIVGAQKAMLFDTGLGIADIRQVVEGLTRLPVMVVNSHAHYDHVGGNHRFLEIAAHPSELRWLERGVRHEEIAWAVEAHTFRGPAPKDFDPAWYHVRPSVVSHRLTDGEDLSLGDRNLKVVHTPGHSPGSICLWEEGRGLLFTGDTLYEGPIFAQLRYSDFDAYRRSLDRLCLLQPQVRLVLPAHGLTPLSPGIILRMRSAFQQIAQGELEYHEEETRWGRVRVYLVEGLPIYTK